MKKVLSLFAAVIILVPLRSALSQTLSDYISQVKGDTLVVKDYYDMNNHQNSLYWAITLDTGNVPAGRVYELKANGYYPLGKNPTTLRNTVIVGEDNTSIVKNENAASRPPLICGVDSTEEFLSPNAAAINVTHDLTVKNCNIMQLSPKGFISYSFINPLSENLNITFDNCLVEHLTKDFLFITKPNCNVTLKNCYFVNMSGWPCRRSGGVLDCLTDLDTLLVENCTHIMGQGSMYRLRQGYKFSRIIFNHNTFINSAGYTFMNPGYQRNVSLYNNMFVNCNIQDCAPILASMDVGEVDPADLPMGLVNVYPDSADAANNTHRKFLCKNNLAYWDPSLADMDSILNANAVNGVTNWRSQKSIMNTRTDSMFKHEGPYNSNLYSLLVTDTWKNQMPAFTDTKDLFTIQLANIKTFALGTVDSNATIALPTWRLINTDSKDYLKSDWPIPVDLSYSDPYLLTGGMGNYPIGDLNWFPTPKASWLAQRTEEYLQIALDGDVPGGAKNARALPAEFTLYQNYPNPFNPSTKIAFSLPRSAVASLKVYDMLGREAATIVNGYTTSGTHEVQFDATNLASGVYIYKLTSGSFTELKKMMLLK